MINRERVAYSDPNWESMVVAIVSAIAESEGGEIHEVEEPLYETITPEDLQRLFRDSPGTVTFAYEGYRISVTDDQEVTVVDVDED